MHQEIPNQKVYDLMKGLPWSQFPNFPHTPSNNSVFGDVVHKKNGLDIDGRITEFHSGSAAGRP